MTAGCKINVETVIRLLNDALDAEILRILSYKRHYLMTARSSSHHANTMLLQHVTEKRAHADWLAERIVQLGGKAVLSLTRLLNRRHSEHVDEDSLVEMITANLIAERAAVESYRNLIAAIGSDDPTTRRVLEEIVMQEEKHAEKLASLLMDWASKREVG
jgi:bacterioferritin